MHNAEMSLHVQIAFNYLITLDELRCPELKWASHQTNQVGVILLQTPPLTKS